MGLNHLAARLLAVTLVMMFVSVASIGLRVWSRIVVLRGKFGLSDWLAIAALPFVLAELSIAVWISFHGAGKHTHEIGFARESKILMLFYIGSTLFDMSITFAKLSTLALYVDIFGFRHYPSLAWKIAFTFTTVAVILFPVLGIPLYTFVCDPVAKLWNPTIPGHCISQDPKAIPWALYNVITDVFILLLPMPELFKLNMKWQKKALFACSLLIGYSVPIMSIGRLVSFVKSGESLQTDFAHAVIPTAIWAEVEPALGLFAISIPPIFQLAKRWRRFGTNSLFSNRDFSQIARYNPQRHVERDSNSRLQRWRARALGLSYGTRELDSHPPSNTDLEDMTTFNSSEEEQGCRTVAVDRDKRKSVETVIVKTETASSSSLDD